MDRRNFLTRTGAALALGLSSKGDSVAAESPKPPNVVLILTDNQGAWTLGCYGNPDIRTPHVDRLSSEGLRFTRAFCNNAVCSPTRATYLTGLMPCQHGVHKYIGKDVMLGPKAYGTLAEFASLPQVLSESGYVCGISGKWHLGDHLSPQEGFSYWVVKPEGHTTGFTNQKVIEDGEIRNEPTHQTEYWTKRAVDFIDQNAERPFFLFLSYNGPYGLGGSMLSESKNRHAAYYADKELPSFPREEPHPWLHNNRNMINNPTSMRRYAAELSGVDDGVGAIMKALEERGLDENTLVIFAADQGWSGGHGGFWGMGDHTRPLTAYDPMIRVPLIFRHPGGIPAGRQSDLMVSNYDLMPSLLGYLGLEAKMPRAPESPGRDFAGVLRGESVDWDNTVFYEFENVRMIRTADWKYIERFNEGPNELFDLAHDPEERTNLYGVDAHAPTQEALRKRLYAFFDRYAEPKWDLWKGGDAKGGLLLGKIPYTKPE